MADTIFHLDFEIKDKLSSINKDCGLFASLSIYNLYLVYILLFYTIYILSTALFTQYSTTKCTIHICAEYTIHILKIFFLPFKLIYLPQRQVVPMLLKLGWYNLKFRANFLTTCLETLKNIVRNIIWINGLFVIIETSTPHYNTGTHLFWLLPCAANQRLN